MALFQNKYRVESTRLKNWDYSTPGWYFVTLCTKNHEIMLGQVENEKMFLNEIGCTVDKYWNEIPKHFDNVKLDVFQIMPDHFHGIVVLLPPGENDCVKNVSGGVGCVDIADVVETGYIPSLRNAKQQSNKNKLQFKQYDPNNKSPISLSDVIGTFKAAVKRWCNSNDYKYFNWQGRFHDRVIRNENELNRIRKYILENPTKWKNNYE